MKKMFFIIAVITLFVTASCTKAIPQPNITPTPQNLTAVPAEGSVELTKIISLDAGNTGGWVELPGGNIVHMTTVVGPILGTQYKGQIGTGISMYPLIRGINARYESDGLLHVDGFYYPHGMSASIGKSWILRAYYVNGPGGIPIFSIPMLTEVPGEWSTAPNPQTWCSMPWIPGVSFCKTTVSTSNSGLGYTITP